MENHTHRASVSHFKESRKPDDSPAGSLHVIFHGTFLFNFSTDYVPEGETAKGIEVLIPSVEDHVLRIGSWMGEVEMTQHGRPATFELVGVRPGDGKMRADQNLVFKNRPLLPRDELDSKLVARILLPRPRLIRSPRRSPVSKRDFENASLIPGKEEFEMATLQIFTYDFDREERLMVQRIHDPNADAQDGHHPHGQPVLWEPAFDDASVNLHIFSAPEQERPASHIATAFERLMGLFAGLAGLKMKQCPLLSTLRKEELERGVIEEETEDLAPRRRRLSQLGRMQKQRRDLNLLWFESEAYDDCPSGCANCGRNGDGG